MTTEVRFSLAVIQHVDTTVRQLHQVTRNKTAVIEMDMELTMSEKRDWLGSILEYGRSYHVIISV